MARNDETQPKIKLIKYWDPVDTDMNPDNIYPVTIDKAVYENSTGRTLDVVIAEKTSINDQNTSNSTTWSSSKISQLTPKDGVLSITVDGVTKTFSANLEQNVSVNIQHKNLAQSDWNESDNTSPSYINNKPTDLGNFTNNAGYLKTESDPVFSNSPAGSITQNDISNWNNKADKGTTLNEYGITDAKIEGLSITLGQNTISVISSEQDPIFNASAAKNITTSDINNWNSKADSATTYTKTEVDTKLAGKASSASVAALQTVLLGKVNILQGIVNEGKTFIVGDDGNVTLTDFPEASGIDDTTTATNKTWSSSKISSELSNKVDTNFLHTVATSGDYDDLSNKPSIGNGTIVINKDGVKVDEFNLNDTNGKTINITVLSNVDNHNASATAHNDIRTSISNIEKLVPIEATETNKLADKEYVVDLIRLNSTDYICANDRMTVGYDHLSAEAAAMDHLTSLEEGPWYKMTDAGIVNCGSTSGVYVTKDDYSIVSKDETRTYFYAHGYRYLRLKDGIFGSVILPDGVTKALLLLDLTLMAYKFTDTTHVFSDQDIEFIIRGVNVPCEEYVGGYVAGVDPDATYDTYTQTSRYVCIGDLTASTAPVWSFLYVVSDISLTDTLLAALNSGITSAKVSSYDTHVADSTIHVTSADKTAWNAKADVTDIPTNVSDLTNDSGYLTSADLSGYATETYVNNHHDSTKQDVIDNNHKLDYSLLLNTPTIPTVPTNVSAFTNDAGYLTLHLDISGKADVANTLAGYGINDAYISGDSITLGNNTITPLTSFTETDPIFSNSAAASITSARMNVWDNKQNHATTLAGYGITDAKIENGSITLGNNTITPLISFTETDPIFNASAAANISATDITNWNGKANPSTTLAGYGITNAYTKTEVDNALLDKADSATTLAGYGIEDAKIENGVITLGNNTITPLTTFAETDPVFSVSPAATILSTDIDNWNTKIDDAPTDDLLYVRQNGNWTVVSGGGSLSETLIPAVLYLGQVATEEDLPDLPSVSKLITGSNSSVIFSIFPVYSDVAHISHLVLLVAPGDAITEDVWFRNNENWARAEDTNIHIGNATLADLGYTVKYYNKQGEELGDFGEGVVTAIITLTTPAEIGSTTVISMDCTTWGAYSNNTTHNNEYTLVALTYPLSSIIPIIKGSCYLTVDTSLYYVYNGSTWNPHPIVADMGFVSVADSKVGGTSSLANLTIRDAINSNYGLSVGEDVIIFQNITPPYNAQSKIHNYIFIPDTVTTGVLYFPNNIALGKYTVYCPISFITGANVYANTLSVASLDNAAMPMTVIAGSNAYPLIDGGLHSATVTVFIVPGETTSGKQMLIHYMRY